MIDRHNIDNPPEIRVDVWDEEFLNDEYVSSAIAELHRREGSPDKPFGVYFLDGLDPRSAMGRMVEIERFNDSFANDVAFLKGLYSSYEDAGVTELVCVADHVNLKPAGVMRLIRHSTRYGCRTMDDLCATGENGWGLTADQVWAAASFAATEPEDIIDIPTLAVAHGYQSGRDLDGITRAICAGVFQRALSAGVLTMVCAFERIPSILVQAFTGNYWNEFDDVPSRPYYGAADTIPMWANPRDYEYWTRTQRQDLHDVFIGCAGLEKYHFAWPHGVPVWSPNSEHDVVDLTRYEVAEVSGA